VTESIVNIHDAKTSLSKLVARAERGERITIARAGKPVAQLGPPPRAKQHKLSPDDPLLNLEDFAVEGPGGSLQNSEIDRLLYGEP
jgi:prevent-host-death family protein